MSQSEPERIDVVWSTEARSDLRNIERNLALDILHCLDRYLKTRTGDIKRLKSPLSGFRLRCGDYRIFFDQPSSNSMEILAVRHRREAYR